MKKIKVLLAVIAVVAMLSTVAFAADSALSFGADTVAYTEGQDLVISINSTVSVSVGKMRYFSLVYDTDVWEYAGVESSIDSLFVSDYSEDGDNYMDICLSSQGAVDVTEGQKIADVKFTKKADAEAVGSAFSLEVMDAKSYRDAAGNELAFSDEITVEAANVVTYEDKDIVTRVVADKSDIVLSDVTYTNVAKYVGTINFDTIKAAFTDEEKLNSEAGIMLNGVKKYQFPEISATSTGTVTYSVLFYGITPAQADELNISTYYNAHVKKAN